MPKYDERGEGIYGIGEFDEETNILKYTFYNLENNDYIISLTNNTPFNIYFDDNTLVLENTLSCTRTITNDSLVYLIEPIVEGGAVA